MILRPYLTPEQQQIIEDATPIKVAVAGRRWGKTAMQAVYLALNSQKYPGSYSMYVSQNFTRSMKFMRMMQKSRGFMSLVRKAYTQFPPRFEMRNGSTIYFASFDKGNFENNRGDGLKLICFDEAALARQSAYYDVLLPMTADVENSTVLLASTYRGRNWFFDLAEKGKISGSGVRTWIYPTSSGMKFQSAEGKRKLEALRQQFPSGVWDQEFNCLPLASADAVFRYLDRCIGGAPLALAARGSRYIAGIDIGRTPDYGAVVVIEAESGLIAHASLLPQIEHVAQANVAKQIVDKYGALPVIDSTGGGGGGRDSYVDIYQAALPGSRCFTFTRDNKRHLVNNLALEIEQNKITIPAEHAELIAQLKSYRYRISEGSLYPNYGAPSGEHDDLVAALMLATHARKCNWLPDQNAVSARYAF